MSWTDEQRKAHSIRMKKMWKKKATIAKLRKVMDKPYNPDFDKDEAVFKKVAFYSKGLPELLKVDQEKVNKQYAMKLDEYNRGVATTSHDPVNHPAHYTSHPSGIEAIQITRHHNFNIGNAIKYLWRAGLKGNMHVVDLEKAIWYINDEIERIQNA